ncbi:MAG: hypothetical protein SWK76_14315 [Actinomycetota bacterium]|nr:hypothetical protein [Actinomycetota bacterium]
MNEEEIEDRAKFLLPEEVADTFARQEHILTFDKVRNAGIIITNAENSELAPLAQYATDEELPRRGIEGSTGRRWETSSCSRATTTAPPPPISSTGARSS